LFGEFVVGVFVNSDPATSHGDLRSSEHFARFYRTHLPAVYGYLFRLSAGDRELAEDLTQDTWMALAREVRQGHDECADIRWLMTVARSRFLDHARRRQRAIRKLALVSSTEQHADPPSRSEVLAGLSTLEPMHRLVLMLRYVDDLPVPTIAATIGRNVTATNSLLARARAELRAHHSTDRRRSRLDD
jgi:RNA polymerase sigma-70 factor (ECF subfamily)